MRAFSRVCAVVALVTGVAAASLAGQVRGVVGAGLSFPLGNFAADDGGQAQSGGGTAMLGGEWKPAGQPFGVRVDGDFGQFCTSACDAIGGSLDVKWRVLNANLNGMLEFPVGEGARLHPYALAGIGVYNYKLRGDDVPSVVSDVSKTEFGFNGGLGLNFDVGQLGVFAEGRFHNILTDGKDIQYLPVMLGLRFGGR
jgi:opacity protein-like surface antigen